MRSAKARGGGAARAHTNEVAEVRDVVNVGQGACDEDVSLARLREDGGLLGGMVHRVCACGQRERAVPGDPFACKARCATLYASLTRPMCFVEISRSSRFARTLPSAHSSAGRTVCTARRVRRGDAAPAPGRLVLCGRRLFRLILHNRCVSVNRRTPRMARRASALSLWTCHATPIGARTSCKHDRLRRVVSFPCGNHFFATCVAVLGARPCENSILCSVVILHRALPDALRASARIAPLLCASSRRRRTADAARHSCAQGCRLGLAIIDRSHGTGRTDIPRRDTISIGTPSVLCGRPLRCG